MFIAISLVLLRKNTKWDCNDNSLARTMKKVLKLWLEAKPDVPHCTTSFPTFPWLIMIFTSLLWPTLLRTTRISWEYSACVCACVSQRNLRQTLFLGKLFSGILCVFMFSRKKKKKKEEKRKKRRKCEEVSSTSSTTSRWKQRYITFSFCFHVVEVGNKNNLSPNWCVTFQVKLRAYPYTLLHLHTRTFPVKFRRRFYWSFSRRRMNFNWVTLLFLDIIENVLETSFASNGLAVWWQTLQLRRINFRFKFKSEISLDFD